VPDPTADRYGRDVLATDWRQPPRGRTTPVAATAGLVVEDATSGFCGAVVAVDRHGVELEDRHGRRRTFPLGPGFLLDGAPVALDRPRPDSAARGPARTASGSVAVAGLRARVARGSRLLVEGRHDAELVERVWGDDLRVEGVVVELLDGADALPDAVDAFAPAAGRRLGVLLDHLVPGSKESRIAAGVRGRHPHHVMVVGHPFVDVWQAVRPAALGIERWPEVPHGQDWKVGVCRGLGWPHATPGDLAAAWRRILSAVDGYGDLEPALLGRVEELIDFVTADADATGPASTLDP
jgi:hypothetical protein